MEQLLLNASLREKTGVRGVNSSLRTQGIVPAVVYGTEKKSLSLSINEKEFVSIMKKGHNAIIKLKYDKVEDSVIVKEIQRHVVSGKIIHVDFYRISLKDKIEVKIPLKFVGEAYGVKTQGGIIEHDMREFTVRCLPSDIPQEIVVDVTNLKIGDSIRVKDIKVEKVEIKEDGERIVASVITPKEEVIEKVAATPGGAQEPEVIAKGKKEEEGAEAGKEAAKPAAEKKPEAKK